MSKHVVITGASSGIGAAVAQTLAAEGYRLSLGARRVERLAKVVADACHSPLDVTDEASVERFLATAQAAHGPIDILINNAGLARGLERIADADGVAWREMMETNVLGLLHVTRRVLPQMLARDTGHIVMLGSIASYQTYEGGSVYCASKRAVSSITEAIRLETHGTAIRTTSIDPGQVDTEFSLVRFSGDQEKADATYQGTIPLTAQDIADCISFALSRPPHVNIDCMLVKPTDQSAVHKVYRRKP